MTPEFQEFLNRLPPERQQLLHLMEKEGFYGFERIKKGKHTAVRCKYPDDWQTDWRIELRTTDITPIRIAKLLMEHTQEYRMLVQKLLIQYMEDRLA